MEVSRRHDLGFRVSMAVLAVVLRISGGFASQWWTLAFICRLRFQGVRKVAVSQRKMKTQFRVRYLGVLLCRWSRSLLWRRRQVR